MTRDRHATRTNSFAATLALVASVAILSGCSAAGSSSDGRIAAIQTLLDQHRPYKLDMPTGTLCGLDKRYDPTKFSRVPGLRVEAAGTRTDAYSGPKKCTKFTWDASAGLYHDQSTYPFNAIPIGRMIVDKVGDEQDMATALGTMKVTPYKAHFEANDAGKVLIAESLAKTPPDITDGQALLHKDADGKWIAQQ